MCLGKKVVFLFCSVWALFLSSCGVHLDFGKQETFRTIADFRKDNINSLKEIFHKFNRRISGAAKDNNFTKNKLDDRIKWLNGHMDEYLQILNEMNQKEEADEIPGELTREELEAKLKEVQERLARYESYQKLMEEVKKAGPKKIVEIVADKGYGDTEDMASCLEKGVIPHVITDDGKDG